MIERVIIAILVFGGLGLLWLGWCCYKTRLTRSLPSVEVESDTPTLLYFGADYCAPCQLQQTPIVDKLATKWGDTVVVKKYDVTQHPELVGQYKVLTVPTTVVLDSHGHVVHINYGVTPQAKLEAQLAV